MNVKCYMWDGDTKVWVNQRMANALIMRLACDPNITVINGPDTRMYGYDDIVFFIIRNGRAYFPGWMRPNVMMYYGVA